MGKPNRNTRPREQEGFTLVELLVVIGIIALLAGLLIPTVGYIKEQGYKARTAAQINNVRAATEAYYGTFHAYPGPLSDAEMFGVNRGPTYPSGISGNITGTENLVLGLVGGLGINSNSVAFITTQVGTGPVGFRFVGNSVAAGKGYSPFMANDTSTMSPNNNAPFAFAGGSATPSDSAIPEFVDSYPEPLPLLYLRARPGATVPLGSLPVGDQPNSTLPYNLLQIYPYTRAPAYAPPAKRGLIDVGPVQKPSGNGPFHGGEYFSDPQFDLGHAQPRAKDTFILISAGPDRIYGTADDITTFGSVLP